ncbi:MAG: Spermine synthase [Thermoleophilia bacterium]|nr:Spermine synthase [Thermoleophilia bacterium]
MTDSERTPTATATATPPLHPAPAGGWLLFVVFFAGAALMAYEIVGARLLAPTFGSSTFVWGSIIAVFLAALALGYTVGGRIADRRPTAAMLGTLLASAALLVGLSVLLADPLQEWIIDVNPGGTRMNPLIVSVLLFGPASVLMGMVSPYAVRLRAGDIDRVGATAGSLYGLSTAGSIVGTLAASFWLVQEFGSDATVVAVGLTLAACALLAGWAGRGSPLVLGYAAVAAVLVAVLASSGVTGDQAGDDVRGGTRSYSPVFSAGGYKPEFTPNEGGTLRTSADSSYHNIRVVDYPAGQVGEGASRVLHFNNSLQAAATLEGGEPQVTGPPLFGYLRALDLAAAVAPDDERALLIGLGSGAAAMRLHELRPDLDIDVVEIDPKVVEIAREWFGYRDSENGNPRITTHVGDGRTWLAGQDDDARYGLVSVDAYFADSIPFHLTTREFLDRVREHLTDDGVATANIIGAVEGRRSELFRAMHMTWAEVFDDVATFPIPDASGSVDLGSFINVELLAGSSGVVPPKGGERTLVEGADFAVDADDVLDTRFEAMLDARYTDQIPTDGVDVLTDDLAPVDSLLDVEGI